MTELEKDVRNLGRWLALLLALLAITINMSNLIDRKMEGRLDTLEQACGIEQVEGDG